MAYRRGPKSVRDMYEEHFTYSGMDSREVTFNRVVSIVDKRSSMSRPGMEFDRGFVDDCDRWYGGPQNHQDSGDPHGGYLPSDWRYDDSPSFGGFRRNASPPRNEAPYPQPRYNRDDLRHQLSRYSGRGGPHFHKRGRGSGPPQRENRHAQQGKPARDRSPARRGPQPQVRSVSNSSSSNRSFSPDRDKEYSYQQRSKPSAPSGHAPSSHTPSGHAPSGHIPSSSADESPCISVSSKEKTPAAAAAAEEEEEEEAEDVAAAKEEQTPPEEDEVKSRRSQAIQTKVLEIEKHYRQDCETFRRVVKMLVAKEPGLDSLIQAPLEKNLLELKQRCLDDLRHFVKELDEVLMSDTSANANIENA